MQTLFVRSFLPIYFCTEKKKNMINLGTYELSTVFKVIYFAARMADYRGIL